MNAILALQNLRNTDGTVGSDGPKDGELNSSYSVFGCTNGGGGGTATEA
ncbi:hypothetical protein OHS33_31775 [Streptomyces sp. NBC_00536]|nr:hypothetical protein [Streptomyces sp. NBC_00536]WUC82535.1 hypothetical protein OHS33_31775 [Streptomyces sp. NBC_00536]